MLVGVDVGGTFTDVVCVDSARRETQLIKVLTDHSNITESIIAGVRKILQQTGQAPARIERIVIGTTVATNVVVQRAGAKMSVFTTAGFEDVLEIGRLKRQSMYDLNIDVQTPVFLSPRHMRVGVPERLDARGQVIKPLDEAFVARKIKELKTREKIEAVAVIYLFSFENDAHEVRTREIIHKLYPEISVSLSSEVSPIHREYERTVVTAFDAYMRPVVERAVASMEKQLRSFGIVGDIYVMQSRGGITNTRMAARRPVNLFLSGPAGGVVGGARLANRVGCPDAVTIDIGGTSCDVAVIDRGIPAIRSVGDIAGFSVQAPMVDINTIGAGGGSLLRVDESGILRVGPASAGSQPGPICYRRGGAEPTITDASAILGYLNPTGFAGGELDLDVPAALAAMKKIGAKLGMSAHQAALGAHRIMNVQMAEQVRLITVKRGFDLREFTLIAFGGAGPLHACALASMLNMKSCIIPRIPGVLSAYGLLNADLEFELAESYLRRLDEVNLKDLAKSFEALRHRCVKVMQQEGLRMERSRARYSADIRYVGQSYEITVPVRGGSIGETTLQELSTDFESHYARMYGYTNQTSVEIVNLRVVISELAPPLDDFHLRPSEGKLARDVSYRDAWFLGHEQPMRTRVLRRDELEPSTTFAGPAIVEQEDTTTVIYPDQTVSIDQESNLHITGRSAAYSQ